MTARAVAKPSRPPIDWEAIEREYRAGQWSLDEIAAQYALSRGAIQKRAKRDGWSRNLAHRVRERVAAKLVAPEVAKVAEEATVEMAAERGAAVVMRHRVAVERAQRVIDTCFADLEDDCRSLPITSRATAAANLSNALKTLVGIERQAFNLDDGAPAAQDAPRVIEYVIVDPRAA